MVGHNGSVQSVQIISLHGEMYNDGLQWGDWSWRLWNVITFSSVYLCALACVCVCLCACTSS